MTSQPTITNIAVLIKLDNWEVHELFLKKKDKIMWLKTFQNYYFPEPMKIIEKDLSETIKIE